MDPLIVLQTLRFKGRADSLAVAAVAGSTEPEAAVALEAAVASGLAVSAGKSTKLTPEGKAELVRLQEQERAAADPAGVTAAYDRFSEVNGPFKQLITDWQLRDGATNDHKDAAYDAAVVARLGELHAQAAPVLAEIAGLAPRFARYPARLDEAWVRVQAGDSTYVARPITDSYHTVWFELHEDLIALAGLTRAAEAAAGRAH
ncbi:MAG: ppdK [Frankiales bacterium]|nr:ppdK [Frankiales bacterium]